MAAKRPTSGAAGRPVNGTVAPPESKEPKRPSVAAVAVPAGSLSRDIWTQVQEKKAAEEKSEKKVAQREASVVFIGPRQSGKSSLIQAYVAKDKDDVPAPTTSLDYRYVRSSVGVSDEKDLTHFHEIGGGRSLVGLLDIALSAEFLPNALIVIVLDLAKTSRVVSEAVFWLNQVKAYCAKYKAAYPESAARLQAEAVQRFGENHKDLQSVDLLMVPVLLVPNKFDLIKDADPQNLKVLGLTMRAIAHAYGASLLYSSKKYQSLLQAFRSRISRHVLNKPQSKTLQLDYTKPLSVVAGCDGFDQIGDPPGGKSGNIMRSWVSVFPRYFPPQPGDQEQEAAVPAVNLAAEPTVDAIIAQREEDVKRVNREKELKKKLAAAAVDGKR